jgi:hypothetical protein
MITNQHQDTAIRFLGSFNRLYHGPEALYELTPKLNSLWSMFVASRQRAAVMLGRT